MDNEIREIMKTVELTDHELQVLRQHLFELTGSHVLARGTSPEHEQAYQDAKSRFQETAQEVMGITPNYELVDQTGPDHDKHFIVSANVGKERIATGEGKSKQEAEQDAAQKALAAKGW